MTGQQTHTANAQQSYIPARPTGGLPSRTSRHTSQNLANLPAGRQGACKANAGEKEILKKYPTAQPNDRQKSVAMKTPKPLTVNRFNYSVDRRPACNTGSYVKLTELIQK
jgi:hypothetical protein